MRLSIVTTLYCSARHLDEFYARVSAAARQLTTQYELVLVNDGSPDDSLRIARALVARDARVRVIDLARNFGHHRAMMTGLAHVRGDTVLLIDSDLEEDPELLLELAAKLSETNADVVYGVQRGRRGNAFERWSGTAFFTIFNLLSDVPIPDNLVTLRLMTRRYVEALTAHRERATMIAGLWASTGFHQVPLEVDKRRRSATTYSFGRKMAILVDSITSFSSRPLELIFYLGVAIAVLAAAGATYLVVRRLFFGILLPGWPSLVISVWLLGGLILACLGVIGIYLSKIFIETKQRPYTIVREVYEQAIERSESRDSRDGRPLLL